MILRLISLFAFCASATASAQTADFITTCGATEAASFVYIAHDGQLPLGDAKIVIPQETVHGCKALCETNQDVRQREFACAGFDFMSVSSTCMLSGLISTEFALLKSINLNESPPIFEGGSFDSLFGSTVSPVKSITTKPTQSSVEPLFLGLQRRKRQSNTAIADNALTGFYKKICLRALSASNVASSSVYAFERVRQQVLLGATEEVVIADTVVQCLGACLDARELFDIQCRSVMFYPSTKDCLLNSMDRQTSALPLSDDTDGFTVDYYENHVMNNECGPGMVTQYTRVVGKDVEEHEHTIKAVSQRSCEAFCTANKLEAGDPFTCRSFAYNSIKNECYLMKIQPTQRSADRLIPVASNNIFEKICLNAPLTCVRTPAFERTPDHVLIGFSQVVLENARTPQRCLSECVQSEVTLGFNCLSVMYYYDSKECVLNYDSKLLSDNEQYFTSNTSGLRLDYYDNLCAIDAQSEVAANECGEDSQSTYVEYSAHELSEYDSETYTGSSVIDCLHSCETTGNFTCRSADFRAVDKTCTLSYQSMDTVPLLPVGDTNHYDRRCIQKAQYVCGGMGVSFVSMRGKMLTGHETLAITGMSLDECLALCLMDPAAKCRSVNYARVNSSCHLNEDAKTSVYLANSSAYSYYENQCTLDKRVLQSVQASDTESIRRSKPQSASSASTSSSSTRQKERQLSTRQAKPTLTSDCRYGSMRITMSSAQPVNGYMFARNKFGTCRADLVDSDTGTLVMSLPGPTYYQDQRQKQQDQQSGYGGGTQPAAPNHYHVAVPGDCGVVQLSRGKYSAVIVITANNLGVPGLVTDGDQFFNVTCDYGGQLQNKVTAMAPTINVGNSAGIVAELQPDGKIYIPSPLQISLTRNNQPVQTVLLGESLDMQFNYLPQFRNDLVGVFIRQCNATKAMGYGHNNDNLVMIADGCPMPEVQRAIMTGPITETPTGFSVPFNAFKFDGGNSVRITCAVDLCEGGCNPTTCEVNGSPQQSFGRKKRSAFSNATLSSDEELDSGESEDFDTSNMTTITPEKKRPKSGRIVKAEARSLIFTVVEQLSQNEQQQPAEVRFLPQEASPSIANQELNKKFDGKRITSKNQLDGSRTRLSADRDLLRQFEEYMRSEHKQFCMRKTTFVLLFSVFAVVCLVQLFSIVIYLVRQWLSTPVKKLK